MPAGSGGGVQQGYLPTKRSIASIACRAVLHAVPAPSSNPHAASAALFSALAAKIWRLQRVVTGGGYVVVTWWLRDGYVVVTRWLRGGGYAFT